MGRLISVLFGVFSGPLKFWIIGGMVAAVLAGYAWRVGVERDYGREEVRAEWNESKLIQQRVLAAANAAARAREQALQLKLTEAINAATKRAKKSQVAAAALRRTNDSLRDDLARARADLPRASAEAVRRYAETLNTVFGECAEEVGRLAQEAERSSSDALMLNDAWPE